MDDETIRRYLARIARTTALAIEAGYDGDGPEMRYQVNELHSIWTALTKELENP